MQKRYVPARKRKKLKTNRSKVIISTIVVALSLCSLMIGMLVAKYVTERNSGGIVRAYNFYFTSNLLDGTTHTLAPGSKEITFTIGNHADELRYSEVDIDYTVTVDNGAIVVNDKGTLANGKVKDDKITIKGLENGNTYIIEAVGKGNTDKNTGGYTKTLTATIEVPATQAKLYYDIETVTAQDYTLLTVWNEGDKEGSVTIEYSGIPDNTNSNMTDWTTGTTGDKKKQDVTIKPHESKLFRFFGTTSITVTGVSITAESKNLD